MTHVADPTPLLALKARPTIGSRDTPSSFSTTVIMASRITPTSCAVTICGMFKNHLEKKRHVTSFYIMLPWSMKIYETCREIMWSFLIGNSKMAVNGLVVLIQETRGPVTSKSMCWKPRVSTNLFRSAASLQPPMMFLGTTGKQLEENWKTTGNWKLKNLEKLKCQYKPWPMSLTGCQCQKIWPPFLCLDDFHGLPG